MQIQLLNCPLSDFILSVSMEKYWARGRVNDMLRRTPVAGDSETFYRKQKIGDGRRIGRRNNYCMCSTEYWLNETWNRAKFWENE